MSSKKDSYTQGIIRSVVREDLPDLQSVIQSSGLFPPEMLEGMMTDYFNGEHSQLWITYCNPFPLAVAYCAPERLTEGTFNLYLIAVDSQKRGMGIGKELMNHIEDKVRQSGGRIMIVETSSLANFENTREFYKRCGYTHEATIREFYNINEDKIVFWKKLV